MDIDCIDSNILLTNSLVCTTQALSLGRKKKMCIMNFSIAYFT